MYDRLEIRRIEGPVKKDLTNRGCHVYSFLTSNEQVKSIYSIVRTILDKGIDHLNIGNIIEMFQDHTINYNAENTYTEPYTGGLKFKRENFGNVKGNDKLRKTSCRDLLAFAAFWRRSRRKKQNVFVFSFIYLHLFIYVINEDEIES